MASSSSLIPRLFGLSAVALLIDLVWLSLQAERFSAIVREIQGGRPMHVRWWAAIPVYVALGYLALRVDSPLDAFCTGLAVYAVYDFTQVATLERYPMWFAFVDSVWGGVLLLFVWYVGRTMGWVSSADVALM